MTLWLVEKSHDSAPPGCFAWGGLERWVGEDSRRRAIGLLAREQRPDDAGVLVGERHGGDVVPTTGD